MTPSCPFLFVGDKKYLALGIRENNRPLIATLRHNITSSSRSPLPHHKLSADRSVVCRVVNHGGDVELANGSRYIIAVEQHAITDELDPNLAHEPRKLL